MSKVEVVQTEKKRFVAPRQPLMDRIRAQSVEVGECLIWNGYMGSTGHTPTINANLNGEKWQTVGVRRAILLDRGHIFKRNDLCKSSCDDPRCVHPDHIKIVNARVELAKRNKRTAGTIIRSMKNSKHRAKLTIEQVEEIRRRPESAPKICGEYGVCASHINSIRRGRNWRDYSNPFAMLVLGAGR